MKKDYLKPAMKVYKLRQPCRILSGSPGPSVTNINTNDGVDFEYIGGGSVPAN